MPLRLRPESLVVGLSLVGLGLLWTLSNLGLLEMLPMLRTWWPSVLILWGALELYDTLTSRAAGARRPDSARGEDTGDGPARD